MLITRHKVQSVLINDCPKLITKCQMSALEREFDTKLFGQSVTTGILDG